MVPPPSAPAPTESSHPSGLPPAPVVVAGLGVLGGSVARALRALPEAPPVWGVEPDPVRAARALSEGVVDRVDPSGEALVREALAAGEPLGNPAGRGAEGPGRGAFASGVLVVTLPLEALPGFLEEGLAGGRAVGSGALVLDLVGMNGAVLGRAARAGLGDRWVAGAPILVTSETGLGASRADRLQGVEVVLSAGDAVPVPAQERAAAFWRSLGMRTTWMDPRDADARVAWTVLLPQMISNALAGALHAAGVPRGDLGPEVEGMVTLAATEPRRWEALLEAASPTVGTGMGSVQRALRVVGDLLARREVDRVVEFMDRTRGWAHPEEEAQRPVAAPAREGEAE